MYDLAEPDMKNFHTRATRHVWRFPNRLSVSHEVHMLGRCVAMLLLVSALFSLAGCNTVAGMGQDVTNSARTVQHAL